MVDSDEDEEEDDVYGRSNYNMMQARNSSDADDYQYSQYYA